MTLFVVCLAGFLGAVVDAIVGGGGLITIPALFAVALPPHAALGTNKFASSIGTISSSYHYYKSGYVDFKILKYLLPLSLIGSAIGVSVVLESKPGFLKVVVMFMILIIGIYTFLKKNLGLEDKYNGFNKKMIVYAMLLALVIGFYDGFFGPGTGSFIIFGLINIFGFDFKKASANSKLMNLTSNITALVLFLINKEVMFEIGVPMAISMALGAKVGAYLAVKKGAKFIKPVFFVVSFVLVTKMGYDFIVG